MQNIIFSDCFVSCVFSKPLIEKLENHNKNNLNQVDIRKVKKAIFYARQYHGTQLRKSGEPYYSHPIEVALMVSDHLLDTDIIVTCILHDTIEDTGLTAKMIADIFSPTIADNVVALTRMRGGIKITAAETIISLYNQEKWDLLLVKLFDRLHNMRTLGAKSAESIEKTTIETLSIFISVAIFFSLKDIEKELGELSIFYLSSINKINNNSFIPYGDDSCLLSFLNFQNT